MRDFFYKISELMYGRYGTDKLNIALGVLWLIVNMINALLFHNIVIRLIALIIFGLILFRSFSKNIEQREKENQKFMKFCFWIEPYIRKFKPFFKKTGNWFNLQSRKFKDRKTHRYLKCPYCKSVIRVPFRKGKHTVRCPKCSEYIKTNIKF